MQFSLGDSVKIGGLALTQAPDGTDKAELGEVVARTEYIASEAQYLVRYQNNLGVFVEQWWAESALR